MKKLAVAPLLLIPTVVAFALMAGLVSGGAPAQEFSIQVAVNVEYDPAGHAQFIDMPDNIKLTVELAAGGTLNVTGPSPWVSVTDSSFSTDLGGSVVSARGFGTVAGFEDILVAFTGTFDPEHPDGPTFTGFYEMGVPGFIDINTLPGGESILYRIKRKPEAPGAPTQTATVPGLGAPTAEPATPIPTEEEPQSQAGDVNGDGTVNAIDASLVLQFNAGLLEVLPFPENGDVNGDGAITSVDAALILQFEAGLIPDLPVGGPPPTSTTMPAPPTPTNTPAGPAPTNTPTPTITNTPSNTGTVMVSKEIVSGETVVQENVSGWEINVYMGGGCVGSPFATATTGTSPLMFGFSPGDYSVEEKMQAGFVAVSDVCQDVDLDAGEEIEVVFQNAVTP